MRIIGMMTVRNEGDIIAQTLRHAAKHIDLLLVVDCGSIDNTIVEVNKICQEFSNIVLIGKLEAKYAEQVRRHIWDSFRRHLHWDDWWAIVDADEFAQEDLHDKIKVAEQEFADHIWCMSANFYYTESEAQEWYEGRETIEDRQKPIGERRKFYRMHTSQIRLFRNLPWLRWNNDTPFPDNLAKPATERPIYLHYQYRDIPQIKLRFETRRNILATQDFIQENPHWFREEVKQVISKDNDPTLREYKPEKCFEPDDHLPKLAYQGRSKSIAKYILSILKGLIKQKPSLFFNDISPKDIITRIKK